MTPVFQTIFSDAKDVNKGNCMQAAIASLFDLPLEDVPSFIKFDSYYQPLKDFLLKRGYDYHGMFWNKNYTTLNTPTHECFNERRWHRPSILTPKKLYKEPGVNGFFYAGVLSPGLFNWSNHMTHAVIIDKNYNVVHDPNPNYKDILDYPLTSLLGYNGITDVIVINKIKIN